MRLHDPLYGRQACPKFIALDQGVGQICPRWGLFWCRSLPKRGQICYIPSPLQSLNLSNLISRYECGRVFPAGVGPGSPSKDVVNWRPSRFCLSVEAQQWYGWLRMVFPGVRLFELQFGALREAGGTREAGSTVAESLVVCYRVVMHQIRRRRRASRSSTRQGRAEPLCARIKGANGKVFEGKANV